MPIRQSCGVSIVGADFICEKIMQNIGADLCVCPIAVVGTQHAVSFVWAIHELPNVAREFISRNVGQTFRLRS